MPVTKASAPKGSKANPFHVVKDQEELFLLDSGDIVHVDINSFDIRREAPGPNDLQGKKLVGDHVPDFQRFLVTTHAIGKGEGFSENLQDAGALFLFEGDADHKRGAYIKDGLQRTWYKRQALDVQPELSPTLPFVITRELTWKDAARGFLKGNKDRTSVNPYEQHKAGLLAELSEDLILRDVVEANGYQVVRTVPTKVPTTNKIAAITPLKESIVRNESAKNPNPGEYADRALRILSQALPMQPLDGRFLAGFVEYLEQVSMNEPGKATCKPLAKTITDEYLVMGFQVVYGGSLGTVTTAFGRFIAGKGGSTNGGRRQYRRMFDQTFGSARTKSSIVKAMKGSAAEYDTSAFIEDDDEDTLANSDGDE